MKTISLILVVVSSLLFTGCQTAPMTAKTTIEPMKGVGPLTSVERTTVVTSTGTNISMIESIESPEKGQKDLKLAEIEGRTKVGVAKAKAKSSGGFWGWLATPSPYYYSSGYYGTSYGYGGGYYGGGVTTTYGEGGRNVIYSTPGGYPGTGGRDGGGNGVYSTPGGSPGTGGHDGGGNYTYGRR